MPAAPLQRRSWTRARPTRPPRRGGATLPPSDPISRPIPAPARSAPATSLDPTILTLVADALASTSPRSAALALLRFDDYLAHLRPAGLDVCPDGLLAATLRHALRQICRA